MEKRSAGVMCCALGRAATTGSGVILPAALGVVGVMFQSGWLALAAVSLFVVGAGLQLRRPELWREAIDLWRARPPLLPEAIDLVDETAKAGLQRLLETRLERERTVARLAGGGGGAPDLPLRACVADVERSGSELIHAIDRIGRGLAGPPRAALQAEMDRLALLAATAADQPPHADDVDCLRELRTAGQACAARLHRRDTLEAKRQLLAARLMTLTSTLEQVPCWLQELDAREQAARLGQQRDALDTLTTLLESTDEALAPPPRDWPGARQAREPASAPAACPAGAGAS
jgi:hypothetical protein